MLGERTELRRISVSLAEQTEHAGALAVLGQGRGWRRPRDLAIRDQVLAERPLDTLAARDVQRLWAAAEGRNRVDLARRLRQETGSYPDSWPAAIWPVGLLVRGGDLAGAEAALADARTAWLPFAPCDILPRDPVILPKLRPFATAFVRQVPRCDQQPARRRPDAHREQGSNRGG